MGAGRGGAVRRADGGRGALNSNFTAAEAKALFEAIRSAAKKLAIFTGDIPTHDPESPPPGRLNCSISLGPVKSLPADSGLDAITGQVTLMVHVWSPAMQRPLDSIDPEVLGAVSALMGAFAGGFTLSGTVRNIDLAQMGAQPGYVDFEGKQLRTAVITLPIIIDDMWAEVA